MNLRALRSTRPGCGCSARLCPLTPLVCPRAVRKGFQSVDQTQEWGCVVWGAGDQHSCLRQVILPGSGAWVPGWERRSQCGGGRSGPPSWWIQLGCVALMGSWGDGPGGWWSGGGMQESGDHRRRPGVGARGTPAHSWQERCPGALCLKCAPRTSSHSPCESGRCAPPGREKGVSICKALLSTRHPRVPTLGFLIET